MINSTKELQEQYISFVNSSGLQVDCMSSGTYLAELAIIAEAPGPTEVATGTPLSGASGRLLWDTIRKYAPKIKRHDCYVTNVVKRQVAYGGDSHKVVTKHELAIWQQWLRWELTQLPNLKYVLLLGNDALSSVCDRVGVSNWRGSVLPVDLDGRIVQSVVCNNPAFAMREPINHVIFDMDINDKLRPVVDGTFKTHEVHTHINPTFNQAMEYLRDVEHCRGEVALDIETLGGETACVGFAMSTTEAMCIPLRNEDQQCYDAEDERLLWQSINRAVNAPHVRLVLQNGGFDMGWLWYKDRVRCKPAYIDTMLAHHCLYPTLPHDLGFIIKQYTTHPFYKGEKDEWKQTGGIDNYWRYNGKDCALTLASAIQLVQELKDQNLYKFYVEHIGRIQPHLVRMTVGGVLVDTQLKSAISAKVTHDCELKLNAFHDAVAVATGDVQYKPNPKSPKQMSELWFNRLRLVGRGSSTDETNRDFMFKHPRTSEEARRCITTLNEYVTEAKFASTYVAATPDDDNRMRCDYKQTGVRTAPGRLSSSQTLWGSGMNLQNIPDRAKEMFIADKGYCYIYCDGSQAEARVVGWRYSINSWIDQFERARHDGIYDAHCALASEMFGIPYNEVPTFDRYPLSAVDAERRGIPFIEHLAGAVTIRYVAKRCRHGLNYRMGPDTLAIKTGLSMTAATDAYAKYHKINPEIKRGWDRDLTEIKKKRALYNIFGRRYLQMEPLTEDNTKPIVAFHHQSSIGDLMQRVEYKCHDDPKWPNDARIVLNTHDGLIGLAPIGDKAKQALRIMIKHAEEPLTVQCYGSNNTFIPRTLIIPSEPGMSVPDDVGVHRWSTIKKLKKEAVL